MIAALWADRRVGRRPRVRVGRVRGRANDRGGMGPRCTSREILHEFLAVIDAAG